MVKERLIKGRDLEKTKKWTKDIVKQWHSKDPDYVFLTETAGTLYGYTLKEAWEKAYPNEKPPAFYRIESSQTTHPYRRKLDLEGKPRDLKTFEEKDKEYFQKRIKKENPKIIVFDESRPNVKERLNDFSRYDGESYKNAAERASRFIHRFLKDKDVGGEIYTSRQGINEIYKHAQDEKSSFSRKPTSKSSRRIGASERRPTDDEIYQFEGSIPNKDWGDLKGKIVKHPEQRKRAMAYVKELRNIGKEAGEEMAKQRGLEKRLSSIIGISGIALALIFLSPTLTGNAIANLTTQTSSLIGAGLFIVGIVGSYFWFKKK